MNKKTCIFIVLTAAMLLQHALADDTKSVNLGRLSIAKVYASSGRKGAKGVQKMFDGSTATAWVSEDHDPWIRVRFSKPVTVESIVIHASAGDSAGEPPREFELNLRHPGERHFMAFPLMKMKVPTASYALSKPVEDVKDVWISFVSGKPVRIDELEIMGEAPGGSDLALDIPAIDPTGASFVRELKRIEKREIKREDKILKAMF